MMKCVSGPGATVRVIIFDLGGVLVDPVFRPFSTKVQELYGIPRQDVDSVLRRHWPRFCMGEMNENEYWRLFSRDVRIEDAPRKFRRMARSFMVLDRQVAGLVRHLRGRYTLAVLSNVPREWMDYVRRRYRFGQLFDIVLGSYDLKLAKPYSAPQNRRNEMKVYRVALDRIGAEPGECIFIDDHEENLAPARRLGMRTVLFRNAGQLEDELRRLGVRKKDTVSGRIIHTSHSKQGLNIGR